MMRKVQNWVERQKRLPSHVFHNGVNIVFWAETIIYKKVIDVHLRSFYVSNTRVENVFFCKILQFKNGNFIGGEQYRWPTSYHLIPFQNGLFSIETAKINL